LFPEILFEQQAKANYLQTAGGSMAFMNNGSVGFVGNSGSGTIRKPGLRLASFLC